MTNVTINNKDATWGGVDYQVTASGVIKLSNNEVPEFDL